MTDGGSLAGKVVIVTGASRGIGAAAARLFAARGAAAVVAAARDEEMLVEVADAIRNDGREAIAVPTDVTDPDAVERLVAITLERFGHLDGAFNNAGQGHRPTPVAELDPADFARTLAVNLVGVFLCLRAELRRLTDGGAIVNMSSSAGLSGAPGMSAYSAAKHGVVGLTRTAALDYGPKGIRVNAIAPGPILTEGGIGAAPAEIQQQVAQTLPLKRLGTPDEIFLLAIGDFGTYVWPHCRKAPLLTVGDIVDFPGLRLRVVAGAHGIGNEVSWLHVSELADPTEFLEGGEFLLTTGLGLEDVADAQRAYLSRLADHGLAGLGFGVGFGYAKPPAALLAEATGAPSRSSASPTTSRSSRSRRRRSRTSRTTSSSS